MQLSWRLVKEAASGRTGWGRSGCGVLGSPGAVLPGVCRLIAAYGASWQGDSALLTHPIATPSLPRRGDARMGSWGHGERGVPAAPGVRRVPLGDGGACQPAPGSGHFFGGRVCDSVGWDCHGSCAPPRRVGAVGQRRKCHAQEAAFGVGDDAKALPKRKPTWEPGDGKGKGTRLRAATTGPMGSPSAALSHPACPEQTRPRGPGIQSRAPPGCRESRPARAGPLTGALRMLSLVPGMLASSRPSPLCLFSLLQPRQPGLATACGRFLFPRDSSFCECEREGSVHLSPRAQN